jgi:Regulator of chromosome condensation (RCC1) repeat
MVRVLALLLLVGGCHGTNACKARTVLIRLTLPSEPIADQVVLTLSIDGSPLKAYPPFRPTHATETVEVDFSSVKYAAGSSIKVIADATANGAPDGHDEFDGTLDSGCSVIDLELTAPVGSDGGSDAASGDMVHGPGQRCLNKTCTIGTCVDTWCCNDPCTGKCEACDVAGSEGTCVPVTGAPHGTRLCNGDQSGPCAGSCDGIHGGVCQFGTAECSPASCAGGVATLPKLCDTGSCPTPPPDTQTCNLGACDGTGCLDVVQAAAGYSFVCAVLSNKTLRCWGDNSTGQIAQGNLATPAYKTPTAVTLSNVEQVAGTFGGACARLTDGSVTCWGNGVATPAPLAGLSGASFLGGSTGGQYCAIVAGGELRCWGNQADGELGNGIVSGSPQPSPVPVCAPGSSSLPCAHLTGATWVVGGDTHTCAVYGASNDVACWGSNNAGQLGFTPDGMTHPYPIQVAALTATRLTAGNQLTCAVSGGQALCWGAGNNGQLGSAQAGPISSPTPVCINSNCATLFNNVTAVSTFDESACAVGGMMSGNVRCWGDNSVLQLGDGTLASNRGYAGFITINGNAVDVFSAGQANFAILADRADRYILGWGDDGSGVLGDNTATGMPSPTPVPPKWQ